MDDAFPATGLILPKPSTGSVCQGCGRCDLGTIIHRVAAGVCGLPVVIVTHLVTRPWPDLLLTMSIPGRNSTAAMLARAGFVAVLVLVNVSGFRLVLARGWHGQTPYVSGKFQGSSDLQ